MGTPGAEASLVMCAVRVPTSGCSAVQFSASANSMACTTEFVHWEQPRRSTHVRQGGRGCWYCNGVAWYVLNMVCVE